MKNQVRIKNLKDPNFVTEAGSKKYVGTLFNDPGILKNTAHVDFNDKNLENVLFLNYFSQLAISRHLNNIMPLMLQTQHL